ncbi:Rv3654c family TadE-like protein [Bifidobacterium vansinderenii]|nr:Rv3654c family TadE-like protein [Bifidobacterium vansinderenii]
MRNCIIRLKEHADERFSDEGSGTVAGVGLILMVGVLLGAILALGNVLHCKTVAGTAADSAALAGATALYESAGDPCAVAKRLAKKNHATLETCRTLDEDVIVTVRVKTRIPLVADVRTAARAGPKDCVTGNPTTQATASSGSEKNF